MKRLCALLPALALLAACAAPAEAPPSDGYALYFAARLEGSAGGDAVRAETRAVPESASMDTPALAEALVTALLGAPEDPSLRSPFPAGTRLQALTVAGGRAAVDLSAQYAQLAGVELSIADACVTLTLTQLDGVNAVRITADGRELPYRATQLLTAADALLSSGEDAIRPVDVTLWFLDVETGALRAQAQTLALYEGQTRAGAVLDALSRAPSDDETLQTLWGGGFGATVCRVEDGVCYVNLDGAALPEDASLAVEALARSLLSLGGVDEAQFFLDGESVPAWTLTPET